MINRVFASVVAVLGVLIVLLVLGNASSRNVQAVGASEAGAVAETVIAATPTSASSVLVKPAVQTLPSQPGSLLPDAPATPGQDGARVTPDPDLDPNAGTAPPADMTLPGIRTTPYVIAVVKDGDAPLLDANIQRVETELGEIVKNEDRTFYFKRSPEFSANYSQDGARDALNAAMGDSEVDYVLAMGLVTTDVASEKDFALPKPVVSGTLLRADFSGELIGPDGHSAKENFVFMIVPRGLAVDLKTFQSMIGFRRISILVDKEVYTAFPNAKTWLSKLSKELKFKVNFLPASGTVTQIAAAVASSSPQAICLTKMPSLSPEQNIELIQQLTKMGVPTLSLQGEEDVANGALASLSPDLSTRVDRRTALNLHLLMGGLQPNDINVFVSAEKQLVINARTARQIGYFPSFEVLATAKVLYAEDLNEGRPLNLPQAMLIAERNNIDVWLARSQVASAEAVKNVVRSELLPQIAANTRWEGVDADQAQLTNGQIPTSLLTSGLSVRQMVFSDQRISAFIAEIDRYRATKFEEADVRLDVLALGGARYLDLLAAKALYRIEIENLRVTQHNLELARLRLDVGDANKAEVLRWESQEFADKAAVLEREAEVGRTRVSLNQTLSVPGSMQWKTTDIELGEDDMNFLDNALLEIINNQRDLRRFSEYSVVAAFGNSPALRALDLFFDAQGIVLDESKRQFFLPEINGGFDYTHQWAADPTPGFNKANSLNVDSWLAFVQAELPLFEGWRRHSEVDFNKAELKIILDTRIRAAQFIDEATRTAIYDLAASYPSIDLSRQSARAAKENLDLVSEQYAEGAVNITDLLDAQRQALQEEQRAAISVYNYLQDLISYQRAISWFELGKSPDEKRLFIQNLEALLRGSSGGIAAGTNVGGTK